MAKKTDADRRGAAFDRATGKTPLAIVDVGDRQSPDEQLATAAGQGVVSFFGNIRNFFIVARTLETAAVASLERAKQWQAKPPRTTEEDLELQHFIRETSRDTKSVVEHWSITKTIHQFHKSMTTKRGIAEQALERANSIGNGLHADYVRAETRRVAEENERLRRLAEAEEQARKDRELAAMEEEAVRREEAAGDLSARETMFVDLYFATGQGTRSAERAGFKEPLKAAARLLALAKIHAAIEGKRSAQTIRQQAAAVKAAPILVDAPTVEANVGKVAGSSDRVTKSAELLDEAALIEAIFAGKYGIPRTLLKIDQTALKAQARDLGTLINKWPGVRYKETPRVI